MVTTNKLFEKAAHFSKGKLCFSNRNFLIFGLSLAMFFVTGMSLAQSSASGGETTGVTYKFTIEGVDTQSEGDHVRVLLLSDPITASCKYFNEVGCFKLTSSERLTYQSLANVLLEDGFVLSKNVYLSDETILNGKSNLIER
ncbi:MAG: hypothetical protein ACI865_003446 [Flavobacteriaceae bacterium]|jgi:hypothetical protein